MSKRILYYVLGLNLIAIAVVLNIRYSIGVAAFSSLMYAISEIYQISLGTASIICYLVFVLVQCMLSRKITLTYILEIPLSFAFGFLTDVYDFWIPELHISLFYRSAFFIVTMFVTAMGVFLCVKTDFVLTPTDGIVNTISEVFDLPFSTVKNIFDLSLVALSAIVCLINHADFYGIGIGTVLSAIFIGRIIKIYEGYLSIC
ncbi:DUF6198 family protein [Cuneatibacter sp. NSJ-177]|uniref:YczE/YyaS/YitT family protein n=1 Tax=Cuneatibacter sp. NSJ-177 TaxID=2931401 RepID=UPI001FD102D1|nr:DUF6198 family protein [Cuneatibacter sp. NSJ-177]